MKRLFMLFILIASNALALMVAQKFIADFVFARTDLTSFLIVGTVLGLVNAYLKPVLKLLTLPIRWLTLGIFTLIINLALLYLVAYFFDYFTIKTFLAGLEGLLVISLVNYFISLLFKD